MEVLYQFQIELSDIDRNLYQSLDFRVAQHPSETAPYLLTRTLAFALSYQEGLEFSPSGLGDPEAPALKAMGRHGSIDLWIEIGNPSIRKLHRASKAADRVIVYTYKNVDVLIEEMKSEKVHRASEIQIFTLNPKFLTLLEKNLKKTNRWQVLHQQGRIDIDADGVAISADVSCRSLS